MTRPTFEERLADPAGHFPYKHEEALRGAARAVAAQVAALMIANPDVESGLHAALLELAEAEVDATADYVAAQEAWFRERTPEARAAERGAADALTAARQARRTGRQPLIDAALAADTQEG